MQSWKDSAVDGAGGPGAIPLPSAGLGRGLNQEIKIEKLNQAVPFHADSDFRADNQGVFTGEIHSVRIYLPLGMNYF